MADAPRARKLAKRIAQIVASALEHEVKDPRLARVTITDVKVTADLHDATVYYTVLGDKLDAHARLPGRRAGARVGEGCAADDGRAGHRRPVHADADVRQADTVPEDAKRIEDLLARAQAADAEVARIANGAKPAGDPDPYRAPRARTTKRTECRPRRDRCRIGSTTQLSVSTAPPSV